MRYPSRTAAEENDPHPSGEDSTVHCWNGASTLGLCLCNQDEEEGRQYKQGQYTPRAYSI